jgi:Restriction Enzyme Adenine Methylase Associated
LRKGANSFVREYLERVSWKVLDAYRPVIRGMIRGHAGVYALYKGEKLYYVGLASNLMSRVNHHLKDRHKGKWERFSVYLTTDDDHIRPLEALVLRVVDPSGNRVKGRLRGAHDLARVLKRRIEDRARDEAATLLGGRYVSYRRKIRARRTRGSLVLAGLVEKRLLLVAHYKGKRYRASLRRNGQISYKGKVFSSPSSVARLILGRAANGWHFWHYRNPKGDWVRLAELKG